MRPGLREKVVKDRKTIRQCLAGTLETVLAERIEVNEGLGGTDCLGYPDDISGFKSHGDDGGLNRGGLLKAFFVKDIHYLWME